MRRNPGFGRRLCSTLPLSLYRKTLDQRFDFGADTPGITLRVRIFTPHKLPKSSVAMVLLCWTVQEPELIGSTETERLKPLVDQLRREIILLPRRVSLVERFVSCNKGRESTESIHKVLEIIPGKNGGSAVLFPFRRSVLESLTGESLDDLDGGYAA